MATSTHPGFAVVQVRADLSLGELTALYWDALVNLVKDEDYARRMVWYAYTEYTGGNVVRALVREWLTWYGERSVECGPKNDYPATDGFEQRIRTIVAKAYKIVDQEEKRA